MDRRTASMYRSADAEYYFTWLSRCERHGRLVVTTRSNPFRDDGQIPPATAGAFRRREFVSYADGNLELTDKGRQMLAKLRVDREARS